MLLFLWQGALLAQTITQRKIDSLNAVLKTVKEDTAKVMTLARLSWNLNIAGERQKSREAAETSLSLADKLNYKPGKAVALNIIATLDWESGNLQEAMDKLKRCAKINEETGKKLERGHNLNNIGNIYWTKADYPEAVKYYKLALKAYEEAGDARWTANTYNNLGSTFEQQGNYPEALRYLLTGLKILMNIEDKVLRITFYMNIGGIYLNMMNYPEALKYYQIYLAISQEIGRKDAIAGAYAAFGRFYEKQGNYTDALTNYSLALKTFIELEDKGLIARTYNEIGSVHLHQSNYSEALKNFKIAADILQRTGINKGLTFSYINIGDILSRQAALEKEQGTRNKKYNEAIQILNKGLSLAKDIGAKENIKQGYKVLSEVYKGLHDYKKALEYNSLYVEMKDSLINNETTRKLEQLRTQFEVEKAVEQEKVQQEKMLAEQKFLSEKTLAEKSAKHELELTEEKVKKEKAIEIEKLKYGFALAEEKIFEEKRLAEQKFESEKKLAEENASHQQVLLEQKVLQEKKAADEKVKQEKKEAALIAQQEKQKTEQKRKTELLMLGAGMLIVILVLGSLYFRQKTLKQKAMERVDAVHKMAELELQSLRAQLNPHFMFNSLNAIQDLILKEDNRSSHRYLSRFSKLLRMLLDNANQPFIPLKKELDFLELYLSLEKLRIPDLQYTIETGPGIDTETTLVPNMTLQPYIENAIWHGLSHKTSDKKLGVNIHKENGSVQFDIEDNGVGRKKAEELKSLYRKEHKSKGMELLSKRFNLLSKEYGTVIQTRVTDLMDNGNAAGTLVEITVPLGLTKRAKEILYDTNHHN